MKRDVVTLDLDGTLLPGTTALLEILRQNGREDDVLASDARYFAGEISLRECFMEQWAWARELSLQDVHRALRKANWMEGIREGVSLLRDAGLDVRMLTDQPSIITDFGSRWGLSPAISSPVEIKEGRPASIDFQEDKLANLRRSGLDPASVCHVGNGSNDVPVWNAGALGIAVHADDGVAGQADVDLGRPASLVPVAQEILSRVAGSTSPQ